MKTREQLRIEWVAALRSGRYRQGQGRLCFSERYCCLGVLCKIAGILEIDNFGRGVADFNGGNRTGFLPKKFAEYVGINGECGDHSSGGCSLMHLNDAEKFTFEQIADEIETGDYYED